MTRRSLLSGASVLALTLFMPPPSSAPPLDREALTVLAEHIRKSLEGWDERTRKDILKRSSVTGGWNMAELRWFDQQMVIRATDVALLATFKKLEEAAAYLEWAPAIPIMVGGKLTNFGKCVVHGLPLSYSDWDPEIYPILDRLAPHYLA